MRSLLHSIGADIFRLNFSHGEHSEKAKLVDMIRTIENKYSHPITILGDLQVSKNRRIRLKCIRNHLAVDRDPNCALGYSQKIK